MAIATATLAAPWGPIRVAAGEHGVVAIEQLVSQQEFEARLVRRFGPGMLAAPASGGPARIHLDAVIRALQAFLAGDFGALDGLPVDLADRSAWDRQVLGAVREIPPGSTAGYGDVARMAGKPGAARAVGGAVGRNPIGLAIPCHRVIAGDGTIGGYGGSWWGGREAGLALKRELLAREGVQLPLDAGRRTATSSPGGLIPPIRGR